MSKHQHQPKAAPASNAPPVRLPGDPATLEEETAAKQATQNTIAEEWAEERAIREAHARKLVAQDRAAGIKTTLPGDITPEMRQEALERTQALIREEMAAAEAENPPRQPMRQGMDQDSMDLIKAEYAKSHKRIVLPTG